MINKQLKKIPAEEFRKPMAFKHIRVLSKLCCTSIIPQDLYDLFYVCPRCDTPLEDETVRYCPHCGQCLGTKRQAVFIEDKVYLDYVESIKHYKTVCRTAEQDAKKLEQSSMLYFD